jgi:hypothetical protein
MKRGHSLLMALVVMTLAPLPLLAQGGQGQGQGRGGMGMVSARLLVEQGSVEYLVTKAADLQLNTDQKTGLEAIGAKWAEATKESREKVKAGMPQAGQAASGDREAMMARMQELRPLMTEIAAEDTKAVEEAMKLLDETQQAKAKTLLTERAEAARPRRG